MDGQELGFDATLTLEDGRTFKVIGSWPQQERDIDTRLDCFAEQDTRLEE